MNNSARALLIVGSLLLLMQGAVADGRYQAAVFDSGAGFVPDKALLVDTTTGHLWLWTESPSTEKAPGGRYLIYQGQLEPGKKMGDIIDQQQWQKE